MKKLTSLLVLFITIYTQTILWAQTGPGGIGNATGTNGQPTNIIWLDAGDLGLNNNDPVSAWADKSGNGYDLSSSVNDPNDPLFITNQINSLPIVRFNSATGNGTKLIRNPFNSFAGSEVTTIIVYNTSDSGDGLVSYATASDNNNFLLYNNSDLTSYIAGQNQESGVALNGGVYQIITHKWRNSNGELHLIQNGTDQYNRTGFRTGLSITDGGSLAIGGEQDDVDDGYSAGQAHNGDIAEIIMFSTYLNDAQRTIIENYLNVKYGITISNDVFTLENASYNYGITGIGQEADGNHTSTVSAGVYVVNNGALDDGDYIMMSHNNSVNVISTSDLPGTVEERWAKDWYVEQTASQNLQLIFDLPEGITDGEYPQNISNYVLLYRNTTSGNYSIATVSSVGYGDADQVAFDILGTDLTDGYYTLGTTDQTNSPVLGAAGTTWYTLVSGDWNNPLIWTLDPSGALPNNPSGLYPQNVSDKVVIKSGKNINMNLNNIHCASLTVDGRLDLNTSTGHTFDIIKGNGRILMAADNFPSFTDMDHFNSAGQGEGTVVYEGSSDYSLSTPHTFFNMEVNMGVGQTVTLLSNYTVNGYLRIDQGTFRINDNTATTNLNLTVYGNVAVQSAGLISTGTANARHQFNFYGDLTNNGDVRFTNRVAADYTNEANDGIVDANFLNTSVNQDVLCNGTTNFYRIEIDKGTDDTYILDIQANAVANFNLFGYANEGHGSTAQLATNANALGLLKGTVKIGSNVNIPVLSTASNYNISEAARLWVTGGTVQKNSGNAIVPYGVIQISSGLLEILRTSGITTRDNGLIKVEGGTINTNVIRTSVLGAGNVGGYVQSGGTVNIVNPTQATSTYYHFSMTYPGNTFSMSGGTLHVYDANGTATNQGGIFIASSVENINVTGGTIIAEIGSTANTFKITSTAPFYNLILRNTNDATTDHILDAGTNINGMADADLAAQPLVVLNDFTIEDNCFLDHNGEDITVGGGMYIATNSQRQGGANSNLGLFYDVGYPNTLTFNGSISDTLFIGFNEDDGDELYVWNLTVNKTNGEEIVLKGNTIKEPANVSTEWFNRLINVQGTIDVQNGTFNQGKQSVRLYGPVKVKSNGRLGVYEAGVTDITAYIMLKDNDTELETEDGAELGNFKLNPQGGAVVSLGSDIHIKRIGYHSGLLNLKTYKLKVDYLHRNATTSNFAYTNGRTTKMIYSDANASDGGIELFIPGGISSNTDFALPLGTMTASTRYTPVRIRVNSSTDDGYIQIRPVDGELKTTNLAGGNLLSYYWRVGHSDFTVSPTVTYRFVYDKSDLDNAADSASFVPGKVLDEDPYTRSSEASGLTLYNTYRINFPSIALEKANYTAGVANRFTGTVAQFHSIATYTDWNTASTWVENQVPTEGSIVHIQNENRVRVNNPITSVPAEVIFEHDYGTYPVVDQENVPRLQFYVSGTFDIGKVSGTGMLSQNKTANPTVNADWGEFANNNDAFIMYWGGGTFTLNNIIQPAPKIMIENGNNTIDQAIVANSDFILTGNCHVYPIQDMQIGGNLYIGAWSGGTFHFPASGSAINVEVEGNLDYTYINVNNNRDVVVDDPGSASTLEHKLIIKGDIIHGTNDANSLDLYNAADRTNVILELPGDSSKSYYRTSTSIPDLYRIVLNKGVNQDSSFTFSDDVTLSGATTGVGIAKALELQNGTLILDDVDINFDLTTGDDDFSIPSTAVLEVRQGQVNANGNSGILLDGRLLVSGGTVDMTGGDNYIQYSASGNAEIEVTSGTLQVGSQIRRATGSTEGILTYTQSGGTVEIGTDAAGSPSRGIFEILNTGSSFTHSAGSFTLVNDYRSNPSTQSFYFSPETVNLSSGTEITFGNANTVAAESDFTMYAGKDLMNLVIDNTSSNNPKLTMEVLPLTLTENLNIGSGTELDANGWDINMYGNFNNSGTFTSNQNKVYFIGVTDQEINGTTTFYELYKNTEVNTLSLATGSEITVDNYLSLETGEFDDNNNNVNVKGNLFSSITTLSSGTSDGIVLNGTAEQTITGSGTYARLTTDNATGMIVPTGNTITITDSLQMRSGVFSIGQNLIVLTADADIIEASPFSESNMIQTNISFTDAGVEKYFPIIAAPTTFIYPMGSAGKYTPVKFDITANGNATGSIRIRAADEMHPSVIEDSETPELVDAENVLQYYWTLDADGITGFSATATMDCYAEDVLVNSADYTEVDYITARLLNAALGTWDKFSNLDFNESTYELYFYYTITDDLGIDGDYTAGIDDAIPDQVPGYISFQDGDWSDVNTWQTYPALEGQGVNVPAGGPRGSIVYIEHEVTTPANFVSAYITRLLAGGTLNVGTTFGHRLGFVSGTGTLYLERGDMPAGVYDDFFAPDSGTIEFSGIDDIDILSEVLSVNNLTLTGTGDRVFPNLDLVIHGNLIINGPDVLNTHNESVEVRKDITFTSGTFSAGFDEGADVNNGMFIIGGSTTQNLNGPATFTGSNAFNHFRMNNPVGLVLSQPVDINHQLVFANGPITTTSTNILTLRDMNETVVTGAGSGNYVDGPMLKNVNTGGSFDFPLGNANRYGSVVISSTTTTGNQYWEAQYYNHNPGLDGYDPTVYNTPLLAVSDNEYWRIESPVSTTAKVTVRWDGQSGMPTDDVNRSKIRMAEWRDINNDSPGTTTDDIWEEAGINNIVSGTQSAGTIAQNDTTTTFNEFTNGNYFTLSTIYLAQPFIWDGSGNTAWNNSVNWNVNLIPTSLDDVTIPSGMPNDPSINIDATCGAMDLQSGVTLTINSNGSLTLSGDLTMDGDITLKSDATGTGALLDNGTIGGTGTATIERYLSGNNYHYISSSVSAAAHTIFSVAPWGDDNPNFYVYDETNNNPDWLFGWDHATAVAGNMTVARGYASWLDRDYTYSVTGGGFNTGNLNYNISHSNYGIQSDGWNLIGNPYPSAINADEFIDANNSVINGTLYFWDDDGSDGSDYDTDDYATWNLAGAVGTGTGSSSSNGTKVPDGFIGAGQGFFVRKTNAGTDPINFTNSMRSIENGVFFKEQKTDDIWRLKLSISNTSLKLYNETLVAFVDGAHDEFDNLYDGVKLKGSSEIAFYSKLGDKDIAIQSFAPMRANQDKNVSLGLMLNQSDEYVLDVQQFENFDPDVNVYLKDNDLDSTINLKKVLTYSFTATSGTDDQRFEIYFNYVEENEGSVNHRPVVANSMTDIQATEDVNFEMVISESTFNDVDINDQLIYTAKLANGADLPAWLSFNADNRTFSGTPENEDVGTLDIQVTVTDQSSESVYDVFVLSVINVNDAPELGSEIPDQEVDEGFDYSYTIPENTFNDIDLGDELTLSAKQADGSGLPTWMIFDYENGRLYGTAENSGDINILVTATDQSGASTSDEFILTVKSTTGINSLSSSEVTIYPNPTQGAFFVKMDYYSDDLMIIVRDFSGRVIKQVKQEGKETEINISEFSSGMYFIELNNRKESIVYKIDLNK